MNSLHKAWIMKESLVFIGLGETGANIAPVSSHNITARHINPGEFKEWLQTKLFPIYKECKAKKVSAIRYIFTAAAYEDTDITLRTFIETLIDIHKSILVIPVELEAFILLPSIEADQRTKAKCYQFFIELNGLDSKESPSLIWLLDSDRMPFERLKEVIDIYLSTDLYRSFNEEIKLKLTRGREFLYGSVGIGKLCFPATKWQDSLGLMLARDLLNIKALSPLEAVSDATKIQISQVHSLFKKRLTDLASLIAEPVMLSRQNILPANLAIEEENSIEKFLAKLRLLIEQKKIKCYRKILPLAEALYKDVKKELEEILDQAPHAPYSAWGFIGLVLGVGGPYLEFLQKEPLEESEAPYPVSIESFLFGWQGQTASPILKRLLHEASEMLRKFYKAYQLPLPELSSWEALQNEVECLLQQPDMDKLLGADKEFIRALQHKVSFIVEALAEPYTHPFTSGGFQDIVGLFEAQLITTLERVMDQARSVLKKIQDLDQKISELGWHRYDPRSWSLFSKKRALQKELQQLKEYMELICVEVFEGYQRLFPFFFALFVAKKLRELINPLEEEIKAFISKLEETRHWIQEQIDKIYPSVTPFEIHIVEDQDDIKKLYYHKFSKPKLTEYFEEFLEDLSEDKSLSTGISQFYSPGARRKLFFDGIQDYAKSKFGWIREWNATKAISFLKKQRSMAQRLELASHPLLKINESTEAVPQSALLIGIGPKAHNPFTASYFPNKAPVFFNHDDPETITGLRLYHGFPATSIEAQEHWEKCWQKDFS